MSQNDSKQIIVNTTSGYRFNISLVSELGEKSNRLTLKGAIEGNNENFTDLLKEVAEATESLDTVLQRINPPTPQIKPKEKEADE